MLVSEEEEDEEASGSWWWNELELLVAGLVVSGWCGCCGWDGLVLADLSVVPRLNADEVDGDADVVGADRFLLFLVFVLHSLPDWDLTSVRRGFWMDMRIGM